MENKNKENQLFNEKQLQGMLNESGNNGFRRGYLVGGYNATTTILSAAAGFKTVRCINRKIDKSDTGHKGIKKFFVAVVGTAMTLSLIDKLSIKEVRSTEYIRIPNRDGSYSE